MAGYVRRKGSAALSRTSHSLSSHAVLCAHLWPARRLRRRPCNQRSVWLSLRAAQFLGGVAMSLLPAAAQGIQAKQRPKRRAYLWTANRRTMQVAILLPKSQLPPSLI